MKKLLILLVLFSLPSFAAIARTSSCTGTSSCTPANGNGDLQLAYACINLTTTAPTTAAGWTSVGTASINGTSTADSVCRLSCKVSTGASEASGTFTSATSLAILTYSGQASGNTASCATNIVSMVTGATGAAGSTFGVDQFFPTAINTTPTTAQFDQVISRENTSWVAGFIYAPAATAGIGTAPGGLTNVTSGGTIIGAHDTNAAVASYTSASQTWTTGSRAITATVEIKAPCSTLCVQQVASGASATTAAFGTNVTAGNTLVVFCNWESGVGNATASDGASFTMCSAINNGGNEQGQFGYLLSATGGATTVTCTLPGGGGFGTTLAWEITHPGGSTAFDVCGTGTGSSTTAATGSFTTATTASGGLVFGGQGNFSATATTAGSGKVNAVPAYATTAPGGNNGSGWYGWTNAAFTGTTQVTIGSAAWVAGALTINISAGGGGATVVPRHRGMVK